MLQTTAKWIYNDEEKVWETSTPCFFCKIPQHISLTNVQFAKYMAGHELIQNIRPAIDINTREFLISGICPDCFPKNDEKED